mgnify:CR=1 FL=1
MMWGAIATGLSWARAFPGPVLLTGIIGIAVGAVPTWLIARGVYAGTIADLRVELAALRESHAAETARRIEQGAREIAAAEARLRAQSEAITAALAAAVPQVRSSVNRLRALQEALPDDFACRRLPLPAEYTRSLSLPAE